MQVYKGNIIDIFEDQIFLGEVLVEDTRIFGIKYLGNEDPTQKYISPGFVDAHIHIESSLLVPSEFAKMAIVHGTVGTVSDPHEIANVLGEEGVLYMINNGLTVPLKFAFGVPSCVPATGFETAGGAINLETAKRLLAMKNVSYLAEMMNYPAVVNKNKEQLDFINAALSIGKPVDGHAPGLTGEDAKKYFEAGISTDHECFTKDEAAFKLDLGVKILIREGSAAKNFDALIPLAISNAHQMMFCSDDKHPDELEIGHINLLVKRAIEAGVNYFDAIRMASLNPIKHYSLPIGMMREGEKADFVIWTNKNDFKADTVFIDGEMVMSDSKALFNSQEPAIVNNFNTQNIIASQLELLFEESKGSKLKVIKINEGQLVTNKISAEPNIKRGVISTDIEKDILKMVVYNRYSKSEPAICFVNGFGLKSGALASSVAHDSHNIIAVGVDDDCIVDAINLIIREKGGLSVVSAKQKGVLPLPIAGIMSNKSGEVVARDYKQIDAFAKNELHSKLHSPYMTLSFLALLVIPAIKLSDKGLFDAEKFQFTEIYEA